MDRGVATHQIRGNLNSTVVEFIKESILIGRYKEGDRIIETEVSETLGISRAPVREGLRDLEQEGIVTTIPRKGTFVTEYHEEDIKEIFDIRLLLENNINKILIYEDKLKMEDFKLLENLVNEMKSIAESNLDENNKFLLINQKDMEFHRYIWNKSGSQRRVKLLESIFFQLRVAMLYDMNETGDLVKSAMDHIDIIEALKSKDIEKCKYALRNHIISYDYW